jgi:biotin carboxyl carrier protein
MLTEIERHRIILTAAATAARGKPGSMKLRVKLEGVTYDVEVEVLPDASQAAPEPDPDDPVPDTVLQPPLPEELRPEDMICRSPCAGSIVAVHAQVGRYLKRNDPVVVIEAMKMQTTIGSPVDGMVEEIGVAPGASVKPGQLLCRLV